MSYFQHAKVFAAGCVIALASSVSVSAATLDFSGVQGFNGNPLILSNATINNLSGGTVLVGPSAAGEADGFCFLLGGSCESDGEIVFNSAVSNLKFDADGFNTGDSTTITAFNGVTSLGSIVATANGNLDFSAFGLITRLFFDDNSTGAGFGFSTFDFNGSNGGTTPLPASLPLFVAGLGTLGLLVRRKKNPQ